MTTILVGATKASPELTALASAPCTLSPDEVVEPLPRLERLRQEALVALSPHQRFRSSESLRNLLLSWIVHARRYVPPRPRVVQDDAEFWGTVPPNRVGDVLALLGKLERGEDVSAHLSSQVTGAGRETRAAKLAKPGRPGVPIDHCLEAYDAHHLHHQTGGGDALLFAGIDRVSVRPVMVGTHADMENGRLADEVARAQADAGRMVLNGALQLARPCDGRERHLSSRYGVATVAEVAGKVVANSMISTAGIGMRAVRLSDSMMRYLRWAEGELDRGALKLTTGESLSPNDSEWSLFYTDLCLRDRSTDKWALCVEGLS